MRLSGEYRDCFGSLLSASCDGRHRSLLIPLLSRLMSGPSYSQTQMRRTLPRSAHRALVGTNGGSDAAVPVGSWGVGVRVGGRAGGCGPGRGVGSGRTCALPVDRLCHERHQRHGVDHRREDRDQEPHRHHPRAGRDRVAITPDGKTAFVANPLSATVSTIDVKTRTKHPTDIAVGSVPIGAAVTPDGKTLFVVNGGSGTVSTIDVKTRTKNATDIPVGTNPRGVAVTPDGKTAFVTNANFGATLFPSGDSVSTIDVKTRAKNPNDIAVGSLPTQVAITPDGKTAFVTNGGSGTVSTIDVKTRTNHFTGIALGQGVAITPDGKTAFVGGVESVSTIDVKTGTKHPGDIAVGPFEGAGVTITPDGKTALVTNGLGSVSTIDVKTRTKNPTDIPVGAAPDLGGGHAVSPVTGTNNPRDQGARS